jgi:type II secretory pathway pseudopilin PulG
MRVTAAPIGTGSGSCCASRRRGGRARARGLTYIGVLVLIALMGVAASAAGRVWQTAQRRDKEQELLFIGGQFRHALERYARNTPGHAPREPRRLEELLRDPRHPGVARYLRQIYRDPMTGSTEWGLLTGPEGEIYGVYSRDEREPLKKSGFRAENRQFEGKMKYSEWVFMSSR